MALPRAVRIALVGAAALVVAVAVAVVAALTLVGAPLVDGATLADGRVALVVERHGPVRIVVHLVALADGGVALVDAGMDPRAAAVRAALRARGLDDDAVRAVLVTHAHDDHAAGIAAFPRAVVHAADPDAAALARGGRAVVAVADGARFEVGGTAFEAFALPGHTAGSVAYLVHGVLFLGDAAASIAADRLAPNGYAYTADPDANRRALAALARRLAPRGDAVAAIAFGHHGPVAGLAPLLAWAADEAAGG